MEESSIVPHLWVLGADSRSFVKILAGLRRVPRIQIDYTPEAERSCGIRFHP